MSCVPGAPEKGLPNGIPRSLRIGSSFGKALQFDWSPPDAVNVCGARSLHWLGGNCSNNKCYGTNDGWPGVGNAIDRCVAIYAPHVQFDSAQRTCNRFVQPATALEPGLGSVPHTVRQGSGACFAARVSLGPVLRRWPTAYPLLRPDFSRLCAGTPVQFMRCDGSRPPRRNRIDLDQTGRPIARTMP
jgi:hypothetical protein